MKIENGLKNAKIFINKHSPEILTGIGIAGMISSTILAVKATPKALDLIAAKKEELNTMDLSIKDTILCTWKLYLPSAISTLTSVSCLIVACNVNRKRNAALMTAYSLSESAFRTYRDEVIKTIGEKKEKKLRDNINQEMINNKPIEKNQVIITKKGNTLCQDCISGRYFRSDLDTIRKVVNELNRKMMTENYISLNEYYDAIGLDHIKDGDNLGWRIETGLIEVSFSACIVEDDEPCIVIDYNIVPENGYNKFM